MCSEKESMELEDEIDLEVIYNEIIESTHDDYTGYNTKMAREHILKLQMIATQHLIRNVPLHHLLLKICLLRIGKK